MEVVADALALGEALGAGDVSDFFPFAETLRGAQTARATTQTLLIITDLFFIVLDGLLSRTGPARMDGLGTAFFMV